MSSYSRQDLEMSLKGITVPDNASVLDIGGSQLSINGRIGNEITGEYKILDLENPHELKDSPDIIKDLNEKNTSKEYDSHFDIAFCIEVSEYWWNPVVALENIKSFLVVGGKLYISFHFVYPAHNPVLQDCLRYTENGAKQLLTRTGFKISNMWLRDGHIADIQAFYGAERMKSAKDYKNHSSTAFIFEAVRIN